MSKTASAIIIIPVYEDYDSIQLLLKKISELKKQYYLVLVDDGSEKNPLNINLLKDVGLDGEILKLSINIGSQNAVYEGIKYVANLNKNLPLIIMDGDGEDNPNFIQKLLDKLHEDKAEICVALRGERHDKNLFKVLYILYKILFRVLTGISLKFGNFIAIDPKSISKVAAIKSSKVHLAASILHSKFKLSNLVLSRSKRLAGASKMNINKLIIHGMFALSIFSDLIYIRLIIFAGIIMTINILYIILSFLFYKNIPIATISENSLIVLNGSIIMMSIFLNSILNYGNLKIINNDRIYSYEIIKK